MIDKILEYQKVDEKLIEIDKEVARSSIKKELNELYSSLKEAQTKLIENDKEARKILEELDKLTAVQNKGLNLVEKYTKQNLDELSQNELLELDNKIKRASSDLSEIEKRISRLNERIAQVLSNFDETRKSGVSIKKKIQEGKVSFEEFAKSKSQDKEEIKSQLAKLEKDIEPKILVRYKSLRQDGLFPIVVPIHSSRCSGCRMELSMNEMDKLKKNGVIECDRCHRIIYQPKN